MSMKLDAAALCAPLRAIVRDDVNLGHLWSRCEEHERVDASSNERTTERFYSLVWPYAEMVLRAARCLVRDQAEADDIAQETMIKAFKAIDRFQDATDMRAWLMMILRNTHIDQIRAGTASARNVSLERLGTEPEDHSDPARCDEDPAWSRPDELLDEFSAPHIFAALHSLSEEIRWTLLLVDVEGMDHEDAAKVLGVPVGTVKSRAFRGRTMLRLALLPIAKKLWPDRFHRQRRLFTLHEHEPSGTQPQT